MLYGHSLNVSEVLTSGGVYIGKLVCLLKKQHEVPIGYLMVDSKYEFSVLSLYQVSTGIIEKLKFGDTVLVRDPNLVYITINHKKSLLSYPCIKVTDIYNILVNNLPLAESISDPELVTETFS